MQSKVINNGCIELNQFGHQFYTTRVYLSSELSIPDENRPFEFSPILFI